MDIEVELRSFISKELYLKLKDFFEKEGQLISSDNQETHYFDTIKDIRIQRNNYFSKIWMKKGKLHDNHREEMEIKCGKDDFKKLIHLFESANISTTIKWFRKRHTFEWQGISVMLDYTKGYGYIIELEKMSNSEEKEQTVQLLKQKFSQLNIPITPKEEFNERYNHYKDNWKELTQELNSQ